MSIEVRVPTLGESVSEATIATWFKKPGDSVAADEMLCELETDKVTVEVPAPAAGILSEIVAAEGTTVGVNALLAVIAEAGSAGPETPQPRSPGAKTEMGSADDAPAAAKAVPVMVPTLGESVSEATVATWFKAVGDTVAQDEMLCELETDKVSVEVPSPAAGVLSEIIAEAGTTVAAGAQLAVIGGAPGGVSSGAESKAPAATPAQASDKDTEDAPSARKLMAENNISRDAVTGTGRDGQIGRAHV